MFRGWTTFLGVVVICAVPVAVDSFSSSVASSSVPCRLKSSFSNMASLPLYGSADDDQEGGAEFTTQETNDMEDLIISLSKVADDEKRRETLAGILDTELNAFTSSSDTTFDSEVPRFAKLFQLQLDLIGETVQNAAKKKALELQQQQEETPSNGDDAEDESEGGERVARVKSEEELQLWALIDMMIQSKTLVKQHMGSLGSEGEFR